MLIISPGLAPSVLLYFYTQHSINNASQALAELKKVCDVPKRGWRGLQKNVHMTFLVDKINMRRFTKIDTQPVLVIFICILALLKEKSDALAKKEEEFNTLQKELEKTI